MRQGPHSFSLQMIQFFFLKANCEELQNFMLILLVLGCISSFKINLKKSSLAGINVRS